MAQPTLSMVHVNAPLTNMSIAYLQDQDKFIADKVFPSLPVSKQSDIWFEFDRADFLRDEFGSKAPGAAPNMGGYDVDKANPYYAKVYAYAHGIPDQVRANADSPLNLDLAAMRYTMQKALINREANFVSSFMSTSVWDTDITGVSGTPTSGQVKQWNDAASTPFEDIRAGMTAVEGATGFRPNTLSLGREVWDTLSDHPDLVDRVKYSGGVGNGTPAKVSRAAVASVLELDNIHVSGAVKNSAEKGATESTGFIAGKTALLTYTMPTPSMMEPTAGVTFNWSGFLGSEGTGIRVKKYRDSEKREQDIVEAQMAYDQRLIAGALGYFFTTVVA